MGLPVRAEERAPQAIGAQPQQGAWKRVGELRISGSRVYVGDSWAIRDEAMAIPVTPGTYEFDVECFSYGADERVAVLRGRLQGSAPDGSREASEFTVDAASAGVMDADAVDQWAQRDAAAFEAWQRSFTESGSDIGLFPCEAIDSAMVHTTTGFGDGSYRVVSLLQGGRPVGFEARFLEEGQGYLEGAGASSATFSLRPMTGFKRVATIVLAIPLALLALAFAVTMGVVGAISFAIVRLLSRLR